MGGKTLKQKVKEEVTLKAAALKGEYKFKKSPEGIEKSARDHVGRMIDKVDPVRLVAMIGLTLAVKPVVDEAFLGAPLLGETIKGVTDTLSGKENLAGLTVSTIEQDVSNAFDYIAKTLGLSQSQIDYFKKNWVTVIP